MGGAVVQLGAVVLCPHGGLITSATSNTRVLVDGSPALIRGDAFPIVGCPLEIGIVPRPCLSAQWAVPAARVSVLGQPVITQSTEGVCLGPDGVPQGPATIVSTQTRVVAQ